MHNHLVPAQQQQPGLVCDRYLQDDVHYQECKALTQGDPSDHLPRDRHTVTKPSYSLYRERFSDPDDSPALKMLAEKLIEVADDVAHRCAVRERDWAPSGTPNTFEKAIEMGRVDGLAYWLMTLEPIMNELRKERNGNERSQ